MPRKYNPAILSDKPSLEILEGMPREHFLQIAIFTLAYSNRVLWRSAIEIRHTFNINTHLNTMSIRYLLILYTLTAVKGKRPFPMYILENNDYFKIDPRRYEAMMVLHNTGLATVSTSERGKKRLEITETGIMAISCITGMVMDTALSYPKTGQKPTNGHIDKNYIVKGQIRKSDKYAGIERDSITKSHTTT